MRFIEELTDVAIVGISAEIAGAYDKIVEAHADAMILDIQLSDGNGLVLLKKIKTSKPEARVVVLIQSFERSELYVHSVPVLIAS